MKSVLIETEINFQRSYNLNVQYCWV